MQTILPLTAGALAINFVSGAPGIRTEIQTFIANPNIAFALLFVGLLAIYAEFTLPGRVIPGALGGIAVLLGLTGFSSAPITWTGVLLLVLSFACYILEAKYVTRGWLTAAGAASMIAGAVTLVSRTSGAPSIGFKTAIATALPFSAISAYLFSIAQRARRNKRLPPLR